MDVLEELIRKEGEKKSREHVHPAATSAKVTATLLTEVESLIYQSHKLDPFSDYSSLAEARATLAKLHAGETELSTINFKDYLRKLETLPSDEFSLSLKSFFAKAAEAETPINEMLGKFVSTESSVIGSGPSLLPAEFYLRPETALAGDFSLRTNDYNRLKLFFEGDLTTYELSPFQLELAESLRLTTDTLASKYPASRELSRIQELRAQLRTELHADSVFSWSELDHLRTLEESFASQGEVFIRPLMEAPLELDAPPKTIEPEAVVKFYEKLKATEGLDAIRAHTAISNSGEVLLERNFVKDFLKHQAENLLQAPIMVPLIYGIQKQSIAAANFVQLGFGILDVIAAGDPLGAVLAVLGTALTEWSITSQRKIENADPSEFRGSRLGRIYVDGIWKPSVVKEVVSSTAFGSRNKTLTMEYGDSLIWVMNGKGELTPTFTNPKQKNFEVSDYEMSDADKSSKAGLGKDPLRNWYFLGKEEQKKVITDTQSGKGFEEETLDYSTMTPWERNIDQWRKVLQLQQHDKWKPVSSASGGSLAYYEETEPSRGLRDWSFSHGGIGAVWNPISNFYHHSSTYAALEKKHFGSDYKGENSMTDTEWFKLFQEKDFYRTEYSENEYLVKHIWFDAFNPI